VTRSADAGRRGAARKRRKDAKAEFPKTQFILEASPKAIRRRRQLSIRIDSEPKRFQTVELPPIVVEVVEYQAHTRMCPCCGTVTHAAIPAAIRERSVGPRLTSTLSYFSGCHAVSKRGVEEIAEAVFGMPIALGTVSDLEREVAVAVAPAPREVGGEAHRSDGLEVRGQNLLVLCCAAYVFSWLCKPSKNLGLRESNDGVLEPSPPTVGHKQPLPRCCKIANQGHRLRKIFVRNDLGKIRCRI
jgi:hypothetical protein